MICKYNSDRTFLNQEIHELTFVRTYNTWWWSKHLLLDYVPCRENGRAEGGTEEIIKRCKERTRETYGQLFLPDQNEIKKNVNNYNGWYSYGCRCF